MRLQLPFRIPVVPAFAIFVAVACIQIFEGTGFIFTLMFFAFSVMAVVAFNIAEGFATFPGVYVFFFSTLTILVGGWWKLFLRSPADSNLLEPQLTIALYTVSMALLLAVVVLNRKIHLRPAAIAGMFRSSDLDYQLAALGSLAVGIVILVLGGVLPEQAAAAIRIINQLNVPFLIAAILLGTIGTIQRSQGRRTLGFINGMGMAIIFLQGLTQFSKQALLTPGACWLAALAYTRMKLRPGQYIGLGVFAFLVLFFANTWSGGRNDVPPTGATFSQRLVLVRSELLHFSDLRNRSSEAEDYYRGVGQVTYFDPPQGILDRLTMFTPDDQLIAYTAAGHLEGYGPVIGDFENWVPHLLVPNKPPTIGGNYYAHEVGGLAPDDFTTGVSYSPVSEAYHLDGWRSILLLLPAIWFLLFLSIDFTTSGDLRRGPWALILIIFFAHAAPESLLAGLIYYIFNGNVAMLFAMFFCTRIAPTVGVFLYGRQRIEAMAQPRARPFGIESAS